MAITLTPVSITPPGPVNCTSLLTLSPSEAYSVRNCPVINKTRTVIVDKGQIATIRWELRDRNGEAVNITDCADAGGIVFGRLRDLICESSVVTDIQATIHDAEAGLVDLTLTSDFVDRPGIYRLDFGLLDELENPTFIDHGMISVENSLFGTSRKTGGPLTLGEIRIQMRDYAVSNDLRGVAEYDDTELVHAIIQPLREWNETPPDLGSVTPTNFPYRYHWLQATCGQLFQIAATWYLRNKLQVAHGGVQDDDRNRDQAYMALAQMLQQKWSQFVRAKKFEINISAGFGHIQ